MSISALLCDARTLFSLALFIAVAPYVLRYIASLALSAHSCGPTTREPRVDGVFAHRYFRSKVNGLWLFHRSWAPAAPPRAAIYLVHGFGEHSGRYELVAAALTRAGFIVHALDHQGHGASEGDRGYIERLDAAVSDVLQLVEDVRPAGGLPRFLLGHSMGALISALVLARSAHLFRGAVLSGAALSFDPKVDTPLNRALGSALSEWLPKAGVAPLRAATLCTDSEVVGQYPRDPLNYAGPLSARVGMEMLAGVRRALGAAPGLSLPVLMVHGAGDELCTAAGARAFFDRLSSADKAFTAYPGLLHEVFNEKGRGAVLADVVAWLTQRSGA